MAPSRRIRYVARACLAGAFLVPSAMNSALGQDGGGSYQHVYFPNAGASSQAGTPVPETVPSPQAVGPSAGASDQSGSGVASGMAGIGGSSAGAAGTMGDGSTAPGGMLPPGAASTLRGTADGGDSRIAAIGFGGSTLGWSKLLQHDRRPGSTFDPPVVAAAISPDETAQFPQPKRPIRHSIPRFAASRSRITSRHSPKIEFIIRLTTSTMSISI